MFRTDCTHMQTRSMRFSNKPSLQSACLYSKWINLFLFVSQTRQKRLFNHRICYNCVMFHNKHVSFDLFQRGGVCTLSVWVGGPKWHRPTAVVCMSKSNVKMHMTTEFHSWKATFGKICGFSPWTAGIPPIVVPSYHKPVINVQRMQ